MSAEEPAAPGIQMTAAAKELFHGADAVVVATQWAKFAEIEICRRSVAHLPPR